MNTNRKMNPNFETELKNLKYEKLFLLDRIIYTGC